MVILHKGPFATNLKKLQIKNDLISEWQQLLKPNAADFFVLEKPPMTQSSARKSAIVQFYLL